MAPTISPVSATLAILAAENLDDTCCLPTNLALVGDPRMEFEIRSKNGFRRQSLPSSSDLNKQLFRHTAKDHALNVCLGFFDSSALIDAQPSTRKRVRDKALYKETTIATRET